MWVNEKHNSSELNFQRMWRRQSACSWVYSTYSSSWCVVWINFPFQHRGAVNNIIWRLMRVYTVWCLGCHEMLSDVTYAKILTSSAMSSTSSSSFHLPLPLEINPWSLLALSLSGNFITLHFWEIYTWNLFMCVWVCGMCDYSVLFGTTRRANVCVSFAFRRNPNFVSMLSLARHTNSSHFNAWAINGKYYEFTFIKLEWEDSSFCMASDVSKGNKIDI